MRFRRSQPHLTLLAAAIAAACLVSACVWDPWIPGQRKWNPKIVVDPANVLQQLALDAPYVDDLDCYARRCQKRFRLIVEQSGQLTVQAMLELASQDEQARMVLEATRGVIAQDGSGRGPHSDVPVLAVRSAVEKGTYFVLLQSVGGRIPYELTATLTPGTGPAPPPRAAAPPPEMPRQPKGPAFHIEKIDLGAKAGADYDPAVKFSDIRTFTFPRLARPGETVSPGFRVSFSLKPMTGPSKVSGSITFSITLSSATLAVTSIGSSGGWGGGSGGWTAGWADILSFTFASDEAPSLS